MYTNFRDSSYDASMKINRLLTFSIGTVDNVGNNCMQLPIK